MATIDKDQRDHYRPGNRLPVSGKGIRIVDTAEFNEDGSVMWTDTEGEIHKTTWIGGGS